MTDHRLPPTAPDKPRHPSVIDLSALIDRAFGARKTATMDAHLEACLGCADQLSSLRAAKLALAGAGRPTAPAGAMDAAIVVSMASAAQAAREDALTMETLPAAATPPIAPDA